MIDPSDLEARFSNESALAHIESVFTEPNEESLKKIDRIWSMLDLLPPREADFIDLYFFRHLNQTDIAQIFGVSQPTVCYRLKRATDRIQFLLQLPEITEEDLEDALTGIIPPKDVQIMVLMWQTTCQSEVAKRLGKTQGLVRHRFIRSVDRMRQHDGMDEIVGMFDLIASNLNILRDVQRPTWDGRWTHVVH